MILISMGYYTNCNTYISLVKFSDKVSSFCYYDYHQHHFTVNANNHSKCNKPTETGAILHDNSG